MIPHLEAAINRAPTPNVYNDSMGTIRAERHAMHAPDIHRPNVRENV